MANYTCILLDADNTLLDFDTAERCALAEMMETYRLPHSNETYDAYHALNRKLWDSLAKGELTKNKLFSIRFERYMQVLGLPSNGKGSEMNDYYERQLSTHADVLPGVLTLLQELSEVATLAVISNGTAMVQKPRLENSGVANYMDGIYISEAMGAEKPSAKAFEHPLRDLGITNRSRVLVVGDDLLADIKGGNSAGLDTCWVNLNGQENKTNIKPKYEISSFEELYKIVMEPEELENIGLRNRRHMNDL